jgi:glycosyltransferase involved in cell wall biosynthesis
MDSVTSESWPRITIVTAVRNGARYIEETIRSVVSQNYPNLEYIVVDGASTDGTLEVIRKYESHMAWWTSQPDNGLYDALNKGFARSTGEIMGWLNSSDVLRTGGLSVVGGVFREFPQVEWITGRPAGFTRDGSAVREAPQLPRWSRYKFLAGANKYIQQESTFWRRGLWDRAGGSLDASYRAEGDFDLWVRFFRHAQLYSVDAPVGTYRPHEDALGAGDLERYNRICDEIVERELNSIRWGKPLKLFQKFSQAVKPVPVVRALWYWVAVKGLYGALSRDQAPIIEHRGNEWVMRVR